MTHQFDVLAVQKSAAMGRCVRARIITANKESSSFVRFSNISDDFRQTNCGVPLRIGRPTMFKWYSGHMTSFAEETGDNLLQSAFSANNFRWIWLVFEDPHGGLLFCFGLIRIDTWFVKWCYKRFLKQRDRIFLTFLYTNRHEPFLSGCQIMRNPTRTNLFGATFCCFISGSYAYIHDSSSVMSL